MVALLSVFSDPCVRPVTGYEDLYSVSPNGTIYRRERLAMGNHGVYRRLAARALKPTIVAEYSYVTLTGHDGSHKRHAVHRLVAYHFHPNPEGKKEVNHHNGFKSDNWASNLEWATKAENQIHAVALGLKPSGADSHLAKLTSAQVLEIRALAASGELYQREIAASFGVNQSCVWKIIHRKKWKNLS